MGPNQILSQAYSNVIFVGPGFGKHLGPTHVKRRLLISSIFDTMNVQHFLEMLEICYSISKKMMEIHCIKNARK